MRSKSEYRRLLEQNPQKLVDELAKRDEEIERLKANIEVFKKREDFFAKHGTKASVKAGCDCVACCMARGKTREVP